MVSQDEEILIGKPGLLARLGKLDRRLVQALVGEVRGRPPVNGVTGALSRRDGPGPPGRVEMHDLHEPARRVGADRNCGDVQNTPNFVPMSAKSLE